MIDLEDSVSPVNESPRLKWLNMMIYCTSNIDTQISW